MSLKQITFGQTGQISVKIIATTINLYWGILLPRRQLPALILLQYLEDVHNELHGALQLSTIPAFLTFSWNPLLL
jgi:hypothetical protein